MGYTFPSPVSIMVYSTKHELLLVTYDSGDLHAWDPYLHRVLYHIENPILMKGQCEYPTKYKITCITVNDDTDRFLLGGTNGAIQIRYTSTGGLWTELLIRDTKEKRALKGLFKISLTQDINGQIYVGANHPHIIQFNLQQANHRYEWLQTVSPVIHGIPLDANLLMTLHSNGDLIYWRLAYKKSWMKLNMCKKGLDDKSLDNGSTKQYEQTPGSSRNTLQMAEMSEQLENRSKISLPTTGSSMQSLRGRTYNLNESEREMVLQRSPETSSTTREQKISSAHSEEGDEKLSSKIKEKFKNEGISFNKEQRSSINSMTYETKSTEQTKIESIPDTKAEDNFNVRALILLRKNRPLFNRKVGSLLLLKSKSEFIECWNIYGFMSQFPVTNSTCWLGITTCAIVDPEELFLFIGSERGFVRTYYIENYENPVQEERMSRVQLRALFPFLWKTLHKTITDRKPDGSAEVPLVNHYRAHTEGIICMEFLPRKQILLTAGKDKVIRLWHFSGLFMGQLGPSADAGPLCRTDMDLFEVPSPPYILPTFLDKYPRGVTLGQRKVMLRNWVNSKSKLNIIKLMETITSEDKGDDEDTVSLKERELDEYIERKLKTPSLSPSSSSSPLTFPDRASKIEFSGLSDTIKPQYIKTDVVCTLKSSEYTDHSEQDYFFEWGSTYGPTPAQRQKMKDLETTWKSIKTLNPSKLDIDKKVEVCTRISK